MSLNSRLIKIEDKFNWLLWYLGSLNLVFDFDRKSFCFFAGELIGPEFWILSLWIFLDIQEKIVDLENKFAIEEHKHIIKQNMK